MTLDINRRFALVFGVALPALQACRSLCFGNFADTWLEVPIEMDAYVVGALLVAGAWAAARRAWGRAFLAASWGFACGIMYRTTFEQLADPARHAGAQATVLGAKAVLFALAVTGFVGALRTVKSEARAAKLERDA